MKSWAKLNLSLWQLFFPFLTTFSFAQTAGYPRLGYLYPAGGKQGTTVEVLVCGSRLAKPSSVIISGSGLQAEIEEYFPPVRNLSASQRQKLRKLLSQAFRKLSGLSVTETQVSEKDEEPLPRTPLLAKLENPTREDLQRIIYEYFTPKRSFQPVPALADTVALKIKISPEAELGWHQIRLVTASGISQPLFFEVGQDPEVMELEPNEKAEETTVFQPPVVINGQIEPGDVDTFRLQAQKGQRLVISASVRKLVPFLADAVPGWFQALVTVYDRHKKPLASADCFRFDPDPILQFSVPETGEYLVEIRDSIYRGRKDFVYRLSIKERPLVEGIFPLGARAGSNISAKILGWNLPTGQLPLDTSTAAFTFHSISSIAGRYIPEPIRYHLDTLPESCENEPNNSMEKAMFVNLPVIVNGVIASPSDTDIFSFPGKPGEEIVLEVIARQLGSPLDSFLQVKDKSGRVLATGDDSSCINIGLQTHQADAYLFFKVPEKGKYYVLISDTCQHGGPAYAYRLRISPPRPDFSVFVYPSSLTGLTRQPVPVNFQVLRKDGFNAPIHLSVVSPAGFTLQGGTIPAGQNTITCTLTSPDSVSPQPLPLSFKATSFYGNQTIEHPVIACDEWEQAFIYKHLVPSVDSYITVRRSWGLPAELCEQEPIKLFPGKKTTVSFKVPEKTTENFIFNIVNSGADIVVQESKLESGILSLSLLAGPETEKQTGLAQNLIVEVWRETSTPGAEKKRKFPIGYLPAIPFQITKP